MIKIAITGGIGSGKSYVSSIFESFDVPIYNADENSKKIETHLYCGFRHNNDTTKSYAEFAEKQIERNHLSKFNIAFSREENSEYVMDLVKKDANLFVETLQNGGTIMICGALAMQHDVEKVFEMICQEHLNKSFDEFKTNGQLLTDGN